MRRHSKGIAVLALLAAGCASSPDAEYDAARAMVSSRMVFEQPGAQDIPAQVSAAMTVDDVVRFALANSPSVRSDFARLGIAVADVVAARAVDNPEVEAEAFFPVTDERPFALELGLMQSINAFVLRSHRTAASKHELAAARADLVASTLAFAAATRAAVYDYLASRELVELRTSAAEAADIGATLAERLYDAGNISRLALDQQRAERVETRLDLRSAQRQLAVARERVSMRMGVVGEDVERWEVADGLPNLPAEEPLTLGSAERDAVDASLVLDAEQQRVAAARAKGRGVAASAWPHVAVGAVAEWEPSEGALAMGPALELELPIFSWGLGRIDAAEAQIAAAQFALDDRAVTLRSRVREAREVYVEARDRAQYLAEVVVPLRQDLTRETLRHYNGMYADPWQVLLAKRNEIETTARLIQARRDYWTARTNLEVAVKGGAVPAMDASPDASMTTNSPTNGSDAGH